MSYLKLKIVQQGFTLVELAIVLIIVGLLLTAFLTPLTAQLSLKNNNETRVKLSEVKEALIGYALSHYAVDGKPYLPCPDTDGDGGENRSGFNCTNAVGTLPFRDLGVSAIDSWNNRFIYRVTQSFASSAVGFTLGSTGNVNVLNAAGGNVVAINVPAIVISLGENGAALPVVGLDQIENIDNDTDYVSKDFASNSANPYDDLLVWISTSVLMNRMVAADRLP